jgi:ketol-acid reductoisomerase
MNSGSQPIRLSPESPLAGRRVAILGYGSQGQAWAANLKDSGVDTCVFLRDGSPSTEAARAAGLEVVHSPRLFTAGTVLCFLTPDETHPAVLQSLEPLPDAAALVFAHGFSVHYARIAPPPGADVVLVAPKGIGPALRAAYRGDTGVAALIGVAQDASGKAWQLARELGVALGCERAGIYDSSFREETEADLFSEQAILCGGVPALVQAGFDLLVSRGFAPEVAYFECLHELKLITDMLVQRGLTGTLDKISTTAKFGTAWAGERIVDSTVRDRLSALLQDVQEGHFARAFATEVGSGSPRIGALRTRWAAAGLEQVGKRVRERLARKD